VGALLALIITRVEFSVIALIGIILLIGIVQKNAIMMIDFALQAERDEGNLPKPPSPGVFTALQAHHHDHDGGAAGRIAAGAGRGVGAELRMPLGVTIVGGLILSQMLTLFTTRCLSLLRQAG